MHLLAILAYEAEAHIRSVIDRIPRDLINSDRMFILVSDDGSTDNTAKIAAEHCAETGIKNVEVIRLAKNQGYGGNQKVVYAYAIDNKFESVTMLHGDGQYPPELIPRFLEELEAGNDVVLGSRMLKRIDALKGGMPLYKFFGNQTLTRTQNAILGSSFSEFHTGYRAYSLDFLQRTPLDQYTNDFHFDTQILLQALHLDAKVKEFAIPTHYGDEVCRVDGMKYAKDIMGETVAYAAQKRGMLVSLKYPREENRVYEAKDQDPKSTHSLSRDYLNENPDLKSVLDLGCGNGITPFVLRDRKDLTLTGADLYAPSDENEHKYDRFIKIDLENIDDEIDLDDYDVILLMDVIEHLSYPEEFIIKLREKYDGKKPLKLIISTPNVAFIFVRLGLLLGRFNYAHRGILDITHRRLFTKSTLKNLYVETGLKELKTVGVGPPFVLIGDNWFWKSVGGVWHFFARLIPSLFAFQFWSVLEIKPSSRHVLNSAERFAVQAPTIEIEPEVEKTKENVA
ncbi:MAG: glycosyltransferase [Pseudomonadota bacterium]